MGDLSPAAVRTSNFLVIFVAIIVILTSETSAQQQDINRCVVHETCGHCLAANNLAETAVVDADAIDERPSSPSSSPVCGWCTDPQYDWRRPRCVSADAPANVSGCGQVYVSPWGGPTLLEDRETRDFGGAAAQAEPAVQMRPQRVRIALKPSETKTIRLTYRPARNYPLDLYYLMDMTNSMEDDKHTLTTVAGDLADQLDTLTAGNYRLGFGTFVDKPAMPFIATGARERDNQCALIGKVCEKTYGFRHRLSLDRNVTHFVRSVAAAAMSGNLDNLEGGLDALMQVIVCEERIGWLRQSRKIVVLATDGGMHWAGDGKLAGVVRRNDRRCHLSASGEYEASLLQDYPSLEEMAAELRARKVNVIFAVTAEMRPMYEQVRGLWPDVSGVGELHEDSSNVLQVVGDGYAEFVRRVRFYDDAQAISSGALRVRYESRCGSPSEADWVAGVAGCDNVRVGGEYEFRVHVTRVDIDESAGTAATAHTIRVEEASISSEHLRIDVELLDDCPCLNGQSADASAADLELSAALCNGRGQFRCGMCLCDAGWLGKRCDCNNAGAGSRELEHRCRATKEAAARSAGEVREGAMCADRGECTCGQCGCNFGYTGEFCECKQCEYYGGLECGGPLRATCDCGRCRCLPGWSGDRCSCATSNATCLAPGRSGASATVCSGHGRCECGQCRCADTFYGAFCELSATDRTNALCTVYEPCVVCRLRGNATEECEPLCTGDDGVPFHVEWAQRIEVAGAEDEEEGTAGARVGETTGSSTTQSSAVCVVRLRSEPSTTTDTEEAHMCEHRFGYRVADAPEVTGGRISRLRIVRQDCSAPLSAAVVGAGIVLATFLLGFMALMGFKMVTVVQDRREFARFEKELRQTKYEMGMSPLYRSPNRMYEVPMVVRNSANGGGINDFGTKDF